MRIEPLAGGLDAHQSDVRIADQRVENARGVAATANTRNNYIRQPPFNLHDLLFGLAANHRLEISNDGRERMRAHDAADYVVRALYAGHPVAQGLVYGVL